MSESHMSESHCDWPGTSFNVASWSRRLTRTALGAILLTFAALALSAGAKAQTHAAIGARGDHQILDQCQVAGSYLVGFVVRSGDWLNQIAIICAPVDGSGHTGAPWIGQPRGGNGGSAPHNVTCGSGEVAVGVFIHLTDDNRRVRKISFRCMDVRSQATDNMVIGNTASSQTPDTPQPCDPGNAITQVTIQWGADVNGVGVNCAAGPKLAQTPSQQQLAKLDAAFRGWMKKEGLTLNATMSNGTDSIQYGNRIAGNPYAIASLTKAITASCISLLVERGRLSYTDTLQTRLPKLIEALPATHDARINQITIAQLLRHVSGFKLDPVVPPWTADIPNTAAAAQVFATKALSAGLAAAPGTTPYVYNNANYALLGLIIEQVTGQTYEAFCRDAVLSPYLTGVQIGPGTQGMGAFGGWQMSAIFYANFIAKTYRTMTPGREAFMQASYTAGAGPNGTAYGLGVVIRKTSKGRNVWHFGNWPGGGAPPPPTTPAQISSYSAFWDTGDQVVVLMDKALNTSQQNDLDAAFVSALGIKD